MLISLFNVTDLWRFFSPDVGPGLFVCVAINPNFKVFPEQYYIKTRTSN